MGRRDLGVSQSLSFPKIALGFSGISMYNALRAQMYLLVELWMLKLPPFTVVCFALLNNPIVC